MKESDLQTRIDHLKGQLTHNMMEDMDLQEEIRSLQRQLNMLKEPLPEKPKDSPFECDNCGS